MLINGRYEPPEESADVRNSSHAAALWARRSEGKRALGETSYVRKPETTYHVATRARPSQCSSVGPSVGDLKRRNGRQTYGTRLTPPRCGRGGVGGREPWGRKLRSEARGYAPRRDTRASFAGQLGMPIRGRSELSEGLSGARNSSHVATRWASRRRETSAHSKREEPPTPSQNPLFSQRMI